MVNFVILWNYPPPSTKLENGKTGRVKKNGQKYQKILYFHERMNIVIVGHKGYIGAFLYAKWAETPGICVKGYDLKDGEESRGANIREVADADIVIYLAGLSGRKQCLGQSENTKFRENVYDIMMVGSKMKPGALLVYASTGSLYEGFGTFPAEEDACLNTHLYDEYTYSMYLREKNVRTLSGIDSVGLRFGTVIGLSPTQRTDLVHIALMRSAVLKGAVTIFGANQSRSVLWNQDLWQVFQRIIESRETLRGNFVYNVASLNCTIAKIANEVGCQTGCNIIYQEDTETSRASMGFSMNTSKIEKELGIVWKGTNRIMIDDLKTNLPQICASPEYLVRQEGSTCRVCKRESMDCVIDFGNQPNANHYLSSKDDTLPEYPLKLERCRECFHTQLSHTIPPAQMFSEYIYLSGTSATLRQYFADFAKKSVAESNRPAGTGTGTVLEIACNDGSLLDEYAKLGWNTYGYDAAKNIYEISSRKGHNITVGFWGVDPAPEYPTLDLIVAQNVCAHVPDPVVFLKKCRSVMSENTILYIQTSQCNMVESGQFDTIYHEHLSFFTIHSMWTAAKMAGLAIDEIEKTDIHGVSYVFRMRLSSTLDVSQHFYYLHEQRIGLYNDLMYYVYVEKIRELREWMRTQVGQMAEKGIKMVGYGAAAKGMTILNYIGQIPMEYIADDSPKKWGYYATNSKYEVCPPEKLSETPETLAIIVFAWNFLKEIREKIGRLRKGKETYLIVPYPRKAIYRISAEEGKEYKVYEEVDTRYNVDSLHHKTILFSHFYNEETLLTQWIRHHAPLFDCAVLIDQNSTDTSRKVIEREAPSSWNVVKSTLTQFCADATDREVASYENSFDNHDWRLALTTTEFLLSVGLRRKENTVFDGLEGKRAIQIQSISVVDGETQPRLDPSVSLVRQKNQFYFTSKPEKEKTKEEKYMNGHYNRYMHCLRDFSNPYWLGRHNFKHPAKRSNLHIVKYLFSPFPDFFARKLQIRAKIPESNVAQGWGFQHMTEMETLWNDYQKRREFPLCGLRDIKGQSDYYDTFMRPSTDEEMLLSGVYMNLYRETALEI